MLETIQSAFAPYYIYIKFVHVFFVMIWAWSTAVAYTWYVKGTFLRWEKNPNDPTLIERRNWAIEQFDKGVVMEHIAFPVILITGPILYLIGPWSLDFTWMLVKLTVVVFIFVPMEIADYWLSHFGGNKAKLKHKQQMDKYEQAIQQHWKFLKLTTPVVMLFVPAVIFLAIVKPM